MRHRQGWTGSSELAVILIVRCRARQNKKPATPALQTMAGTGEGTSAATVDHPGLESGKQPCEPLRKRYANTVSH
jgi:hypothetical protein